METLIIGIDGGEWDVIEPMIKSGELPHLAQLKREGMAGPLESVAPPVSPPAWNSIQTGTNPGKHGIFDFTKFDENYHRRSINSTDRRATPFWQIMNDNNLTTGLFKVPFTYPPDDVDGFMVTGFPTPTGVRDFTKPLSLSKQVGPIAKLFEDWSFQKAGEYEGFLQNLLDVAEHQTTIFLKLLREHDTDLSMTVYDGADRIQHFFWKYFDDAHPRYEPSSPLVGAIEKYYQTIDRGIGRICNQVGTDCNVVVMSDHGFGPLSYDIYIDEWLEREGFLTRKSLKNPTFRVRKLLSLVVERSWQVVTEMNLSHHVKSLLPARLLERGRAVRDIKRGETVWNETFAFFSNLSGQSIYINLDNKFEHGTVSSQEYDDLIKRLRSSLFDLEDPDTGESLVKSVVRSEEVFEGWAMEKAPDLIIETRAGYTLKGGRADNLVRPSMQNKNDRSGDHRKEGLLIANGPVFSKGTVKDASVLDIAPTLLYFHRCPIPQTMDGKILSNILDDTVKDQISIKRTSEYGRPSHERQRFNVEDEEEIKERLHSMGYID